MLHRPVQEVMTWSGEVIAEWSEFIKIKNAEDEKNKKR